MVHLKSDDDELGELHDQLERSFLVNAKLVKGAREVITQSILQLFQFRLHLPLETSARLSSQYGLLLFVVVVRTGATA